MRGYKYLSFGRCRRLQRMGQRKARGCAALMLNTHAACLQRWLLQRLLSSDLLAPWATASRGKLSKDIRLDVTDVPSQK